MFQPGDKVSFVNEKQEGIIVTIQPNGMIVVEIEDGFPIEVTARELVKKHSILITEKEQQQKKEKLFYLINEKFQNLKQIKQKSKKML